MKVVAVCLLHTKLIWHQRYQLWHRAVWQICTDISQYLPFPSSEWWRQQVPLRRLHNYWLTVAGPRWQATSPPPPCWEPQISFYTTLNKSLKSWPKPYWNEIVNSDTELLYVWVWLSGCLWTSQKVSSACGWDLSFSLQVHVCPAGMWHCSLIDMCQDCNWAQGNQT